MNTHTRKANYDVNEHSLCSENSFRQVEAYYQCGSGYYKGNVPEIEPNDNPWVIPEDGPYERDPVEDEPYEGDPIEDEPYVEDPVEDSPSIEICDY